MHTAPAKQRILIGELSLQASPEVNEDGEFVARVPDYPPLQSELEAGQKYEQELTDDPTVEDVPVQPG